MVSNSGAIKAQLQAELNHAGFQASCNHLTRSQMGSQPVSLADRARRGNENQGSEGLLIQPLP